MRLWLKAISDHYVTYYSKVSVYINSVYNIKYIKIVNFNYNYTLNENKHGLK